MLRIWHLSFLCCAGTALTAAESQGDLDELAQKLANPIASLISLPFQANDDSGLGATEDGERFQLNVQPVIPLSLNAEWNLISRTIVPLISQNDVIPGTDQSGLGDVSQSVFISPTAPGHGGMIWGAGPVLLLPTATDELLGGEQWAAGPTAVALVQTNGWTVGLLVNHLWSFAGDDDRADINASYGQPFLAKGVWKGGTVTVSAESSYDWNAEDDQLTMPLIGQVSQILPIAGQLTSIGLAYKHYVAGPDSAPDWGLRLTFSLLFPR